MNEPETSPGGTLAVAPATVAPATGGDAGGGDPATGSFAGDAVSVWATAGGPGCTRISEQAVERTAARLVAECPDVGGTAKRMLGVSMGEAGDRDADVSARLHGTTAVSLTVRCSVPYPRPVGRSTEALRQLLVRRVAELTGLRVQRVDITVTELNTGTGRRVQ